ncbi:MAG: hypothetical protein HC915_08740 [Anaerolineae bacterium]|nr:hypothetical protein [Anaerolineae bacterium]
MELILILLGLVLLIYILGVVQQWQTTRNLVIEAEDKPIVPVNLVEGNEAVVVAEGRGHLVYINEKARNWFGMNGAEPNLTLMAQRVNPSDTFRDLFAREGRVLFRVGSRQVEATSHAIPVETGRRMVVVMREAP